MSGSSEADRNLILQELRTLMTDAQHASDLGALKSIYYRAQTIAQEHPSDATMQRAVAEIKNIVITRGKTLQAPGTASLPVPTGFSSAAPGTAPIPTPAEMKTSQPSIAPPPPATPVKASGNIGALRPKPATPAPPAPSINWKIPILAGAGMAIALVAGSILFFKKTSTAVPPVNPATVGVLEIHTTPPGASLLINGKPSGKSDAKLELPAGQYELQALLDGYEPAARTIAIPVGAPLNLTVPLIPASTAMRLVADIESGNATLDGQAIPLQAGQINKDKVAPGAHTLKVASRDGEATIQFELPPGQVPRVMGIANVKNFLPIVIANLGNQAHIQSNTGKPVKVALDGKPAGEVSAAGLDLKDVPVGDHELTWGEGSDEKKLIVHFGPAPSITAHLKLDINAGTLVVVTGEDKARILLNGKPYAVLTAHGQVRIPKLAVQTYTVTVSKDGYQQVPEQKVEIKKGTESKLQFAMKALPQLSVLRLEGATPGAIVVFDKETIGTVQTDGFLSHSGIAPGEHVIELRRDGLQTKTFKKNFVAGSAIALSGSDVILEPLQGQVKLAVTPPNAQLTYHRNGEAQSITVTGNSLSLPEGTYTLSARATGFKEQEKGFIVRGGSTTSVEIALIAEKAPTVQPTALNMNAFDSLGSWRKDGEWLVHKGGNFVLTKAPNTPGRLSFSAKLFRSSKVFGSNPLQWVVHYTDARNYVIYKLDKKNLTRYAMVNGVKKNEQKSLHNLEEPDTLPMAIEITPHKITHTLFINHQTVPLDTYTDETTDLTTGRFGFYIPGNDEVGLALFTYQPQ